MITKTPLIITDKNGTIIYCNEAAHNICAALSFGNSVKSLFNDDELNSYKQALGAASDSFSVKSSFLGGAELIFDLTKEASDGTRQIFIRKSTSAAISSVSYENVASEFASALRDSALSDCNHSKRRFTELYETLAALSSSFDLIRHLDIFELRALIDAFHTHILPNFLPVYGTVHTTETGITEKSVVYAEPYGFYLTLCAMLSAASFVSCDQDILLDIDDRCDAVAINVSVTADEARFDDPIPMYGVHYVDIIFADTLARASGYLFSYESNRDTGRVCFTLYVKCRDYYPIYLKAKSSTAQNAAIFASLFPFSAEKENDKH